MEEDLRILTQARALAMFIFLCICAGGVMAYAQSSGSLITDPPASTGSSVRSTLQDLERQRAEALWQERIAKSDTFLRAMRSDRSTVVGMRKNIAKNIADRDENRSKCFSTIRTANKFSKLASLLRCYRVELLLDVDRVQYQRTYVENMQGINDDVRDLTLTRINLLSDALDSIITGIDSDVFESEEHVLETKDNLLANYRIPAWLALTKLRAEQFALWVDSLMTQIALIGEQYVTTPELSAFLVDGLGCINDGHEMFEAIRSATEYGQALAELIDAEEYILGCLNDIEMLEEYITGERVLPTLPDSVETSSGSTEPDEEPADDLYIKRRLLRRPGQGFRIFLPDEEPQPN